MGNLITVFGATGAQGGGVVRALLFSDRWHVRAVTRDRNSSRARELAAAGCEVVEADLADPTSLSPTFAGAYGAFVVTNFWDTDSKTSEFDQGKAAVQAARDAGVQHFIWSTLPNYNALSGGKYSAHHYAGKARVDAVVTSADFRYYSFVQAPMYYQNLLTVMAPKLRRDGGKLWRFPMASDIKCINLGDISDLGLLVAAALEQPEKGGRGEYMALSGDYMSWQEIVDVLDNQGHSIRYEQVPNEDFDALYDGAREFREMMNFWEDQGYYGPQAGEMLRVAKELVPEGFTRFADWASAHLEV